MMWKSRTTRILALACISVLNSACGFLSTGPPGAGGPGGALVMASDSLDKYSNIEWGECAFPIAGPVRCGVLGVPEDWSKPNTSNRIRLTFAILGAKKASDSPHAPIAYLTGGPGVSTYIGLEHLRESRLNDQRDIVMLEPRGYGYSKPWLACDSVEQLRACYDNYTGSGIDVTLYSTEFSVYDYEALRIRLGLEKWNIYAVSYGTFWASHYARLFPNSLRSLMMDSPYPAEAGYDWNVVSALNGFELVFSSCRANLECDRAFPDLRNRFIGALRRLKDTPVEWNGKLLDHREAFASIYHSLYIASTIHRVPMMIDAVADGNYELFTKIGDVMFVTLPENFDVSRLRSLGLNVSIMCMEDVHFDASATTRVAYSARWPADIIEMINPEGWDYDVRCASWPMPLADKIMNSPIKINTPAIVLVGGFDPLTPKEFAEAMLLGMSNGKLAFDPATSHGLFVAWNSCVETILMNFIREPDQHVDMSCLLDRKPNWLLPRHSFDRPAETG
jgi:pimeloyl-ACP methyl ester carboxylesterase